MNVGMHQLTCACVRAMIQPAAAFRRNSPSFFETMTHGILCPQHGVERQRHAFSGAENYNVAARLLVVAHDKRPRVRRLPTMHQSAGDHRAGIMVTYTCSTTTARAPARWAARHLSTKVTFPRFIKAIFPNNACTMHVLSCACE